MPTGYSPKDPTQDCSVTGSDRRSWVRDTNVLFRVARASWPAGPASVPGSPSHELGWLLEGKQVSQRRPGGRLCPPGGARHQATAMSPAQSNNTVEDALSGSHPPPVAQKRCSPSVCEDAKAPGGHGGPPLRGFRSVQRTVRGHRQHVLVPRGVFGGHLEYGRRHLHHQNPVQDVVPHDSRNRPPFRVDELPTRHRYPSELLQRRQHLSGMRGADNDPVRPLVERDRGKPTVP